MSVSEFARHRGVHVEVVSRAITDGRITREPDGSINVEQAEADWKRNTQTRNLRKARRDPGVDFKAGLKRRETWAKKLAARAKAVAAAQVAPAAAEIPAVPAEDDAPEPRPFASDAPGSLEDNSLSYSEARALKENLDAKLKQIELAQRQGSVLPRGLVVEALQTLFRVHRDSVLNVPNRIAALVFEQTSVADVHAVLDEELRKSLEELADGLEKLAERTAKAA